MSAQAVEDPHAIADGESGVIGGLSSMSQAANEMSSTQGEQEMPSGGTGAADGQINAISSSAPRPPVANIRQVEYLCRKCRAVLFSATQTTSHTSQGGAMGWDAGLCSAALFLAGDASQLNSSTRMTMASGTAACSACSAKVGRFSSGMCLWCVFH